MDAARNSAQQLSLEAGHPHRDGRAAGQPAAGVGFRRHPGRCPPCRSLDLALHALRQSAPQPGVGQSLSRRIQPASGLSHGWRAGAARLLQPPHGTRPGHAPRGFDWPGLRHHVHPGRHASAQLLADPGGIVPVHRVADGRALRGFSVGAGEGAPGRHHAHRFRHALSRPTRSKTRWKKPCTACRTISR